MTEKIMLASGENFQSDYQLDVLLCWDKLYVVLTSALHSSADF